MLDSFLDAIKIPNRPGFEEWCENNVSLSSDYAAKSGPFSLSLTPYMKHIYSCLDHNSGIKRVTLMMGSQLGKTQMSLNFILYRQDILPGPMMFVLPTIKKSQEFSRERMKPMFDNTPVVRRLTQKVAGQAESQTVVMKKFTGGFIKLVGSNSPSDLSSTPIRDLLLDETDRFTKDVKGEGDPIGLALKRTTSFHNSIVIDTSTPTIHNDSLIEEAFNKSTRYFYYVPCPYCQERQILEIENLSVGGYECQECKKKIEDQRYKTWMLDEGKWITKDPETEHVGFHLSQLYAPYLFVTWAQILKEKEEALEDPEKMKVFKNTALAVTYQEIGESAEWKDVMEKTTMDYREGVIWEDTVAVTMAVDCQKDHLVYEVRGWQKKLVSYSVLRGTIVGAIGEESGKEGLEELIAREFKEEGEGGRTHKIDKTLIDSSYDTADVYTFCKAYSHYQVAPIKGVDQQAFAVSIPTKTALRDSGRRMRKRGLFFYKIGTSLLKKRIYSIFNMSDENYQNEKVWRRIFYPKSYDREWFEQLCAEQLIVVRNKITNQSKRVWKKKRERNEALDLAVYNLAAAHLLQLEDDAIAEKLKNRAKDEKPEKKKKSPRKESSLEIGL